MRLNQLWKRCYKKGLTRHWFFWKNGFVQIVWIGVCCFSGFQYFLFYNGWICESADQSWMIQLIQFFKRHKLVGKKRTNLQKVMCTAKVIVLD